MKTKLIHKRYVKKPVGQHFQNLAREFDIFSNFSLPKPEKKKTQNYFENENISIRCMRFTNICRSTLMSVDGKFG